MFLIERASKSLASGMASKLNLGSEREEVLAYGAFALLQTVWSILLVIILGAIFGVLGEAFVASLAISFLRKYSGGAHSTSPNRCAVIGAIIGVLLAFMAIWSADIIGFYGTVAMFFLSFLMSYIIIKGLAPVDSPGKPIKKAEKRSRLKRASLNMLHFLLLIATVLYAVYYIYDLKGALIYGLCISTGVAWQSFTLTKPGHLILGAMDVFFQKNLRL